MENKGEALAELYRGDFTALPDSELINKFNQYAYVVYHLDHSFKDAVALDVLATILIERGLKTLDEIKDYIQKVKELPDEENQE